VIRQVTYLRKILAQDHRAVTRVTRPTLGFKSVDAAQGTLAGIAPMHRHKEGPRVAEAGAEGLTPAAPCYALAAESPRRHGQRIAMRLRTNNGDRSIQSIDQTEP
jgi:putative transposase